MTIMLPAAGMTVGQSVQLPQTQHSYTVDTYGYVNISNNSDLAFLQDLGFFLLPRGRDNLTAVTDPGSTNDNTQDFQPGGLWSNTAVIPNRIWICTGSATGAATWAQLGTNSTTPGAAKFSSLVLTGLLNMGFTGAITAFGGGGQSNATQLVSGINIISTVAAPGDSVKLPAIATLTNATGAPILFVLNSAANPMQVFGTSPDTVNGVATATGEPQAAGSWEMYIPTTAGNWTTFGGETPQQNFVYNTDGHSATFTLGVSSITGGFIEVALGMTGSLGSGATVTLPTMSNLVAGVPDAYAGQNWKLRILNESTGANAWTLSNNSWTSFNAPSNTVPQGNWREFIITITNPATPTVTLQAVGGGSLSI